MLDDPDLVLILIALLAAVAALGVPVIVRTWRRMRRPESFRVDRAANDPER